MSLEGDLDLAASDRLTADVAHHVVAGRQVRIDLAGLTFVDSSGIRVLLWLTSHARARRATLSFTRPADAGVIRAIELSGIERLLPFDESPVPGE